MTKEEVKTRANAKETEKKTRTSRPNKRVASRKKVNESKKPATKIKNKSIESKKVSENKTNKKSIVHSISIDGKKKNVSFVLNKLTDFFEMTKAIGEFYPESAWDKMSYYLSTKKGFSSTRDKEKFKNFIDILLSNKMAYSNRDYITTKSSSEFKLIAKNNIDKRNFFVMKIDSSLWKEYESNNIVAFENTQALFSKINKDDECLFVDEKNRLYGFGYLNGESMYCNTRLINNKIIPYQMDVKLKKFEHAPYMGENVLKNDIEEIKRTDFYNLLIFAIEKQMEFELFRKNSLLDVYDEMEKTLPETRYFYQKIEKILLDISDFYGLNVSSRRDRTWKYFSMSIHGHDISRVGLLCDLLPYFAEKLRPNPKFKVVVLGKKQEKHNLISCERLWYIFKHIVALNNEKNCLFK